MSETEFDYMKEARKTLSPQFHGELVSKAQMQYALAEAIEALKHLDKIKKALFYGRIVEGMFDAKVTYNAEKISEIISANEKCTNIVHGIIGKATESGELLEALFDLIEKGKPFDEVNVLEEVGDGFWYDAIILESIESNFGQAQIVNINKLKARFPKKFTEKDANERDLTKERAILESRN